MNEVAEVSSDRIASAGRGDDSRLAVFVGASEAKGDRLTAAHTRDDLLHTLR
jgi:hypothetical protein